MTSHQEQNPSIWQPLCRIDDLNDNDTRGFECGETPLIVLKRKGQWQVYINSCPHLGIRLEWQPHQFLDVDGHYIQCSSHGALFRPDNGVCVSGPCVHQSLQAVEHKIEDQQLWIKRDQF